MKDKAHYLILADIMLEHDKYYSLKELVERSGFKSSKVEAQMAAIRARYEYRLLIDRTGTKNKYGLKMVDDSEWKRDFVTELFTGQVMRSIELSRLIIRCVDE